jgi:hypothetical protein
LFDEAVHFLSLINDWKSSFLIGAMLKESENYNGEENEEARVEKMLALKVCSLLGKTK